MGFFQSWLPRLYNALAFPPDGGSVSPADEIAGSLAGVAASAGNPRAMESLNEQRQNRRATADLQMRRTLQQSELQNQELQRQHLQQENAAFQTPAQKQQMELDTLRKQLGIQRELAPPELMPTTGANGEINYYQRKFNPDTGDFDITPAMATKDVVVSSPDNPQIPYAPDKTIFQKQRVPLTTQNPEVFKNNLELSREIAFATDPRVMQGKIDVAKAEGQARANQETALARGSNAALANVPPHLINAATEAATKAGTEYAQAKCVSDRLSAMMTAAKNGNVVSYQLIPQEGALQVVTSQGIHRINMAEIQNYGGGSLWQRMEGHLGKNLTGKSIPDSVLDDMSEMQQIQAQGAQTKYQNSLKTINQYYDSSFQPVEMDSMGASNRGSAGQPATPPQGATMKVPGSDGKLHWSDGKQDLGVVQ